MNNKIWSVSSPNFALEEYLSKTLNLSSVLVRILINRGLTTEEQISAFLNTNKQSFFNPFLLKDMDIVIERIISAITNKERIAIYGDYDVDGITATSVLVKVLDALGADVIYYIPERQCEGYGIHVNALEGLIAKGVSLLITVDCGISSVEEVASVKNRLDIIITDHHRPPEILPEAFGIINPKQEGCPYPDKEIAGVGVAYKVCQALWKKIQKQELREYLDIVALGTVADVVPLVGENRLIVTLGLEQLNHTKNLGLKSLIKNCGLADKTINAGKVGFILAPRLNAVGRLDNASIGVKLLLTHNLQEAEQISDVLETENHNRQCIEKEILAEAEEALKEFDLSKEKVIVLSGLRWNIGVVGIVASRLVDKYYKPVIIISEAEGIGKGSCRSISGFDIYKALKKCADLLEKFGGHSQAAGLSILPENISQLRDELTIIAQAELTDEDYVPKVHVDSAIDLEQINGSFIETLKCLEPYGMGNPQPIFACRDLEILNTQKLGQEGKHLRFNIKQNKTIVQGIAWGKGDLTEALDKAGSVNLVFQPEINEWQGRCNIQLIAHDFQNVHREKGKLDELYSSQPKEIEYNFAEDVSRFFNDIDDLKLESRHDFQISNMCDSRNIADKSAYIKNLMKNDEQILVLVNDAKQAIGIASTLREEKTELQDKIAFYFSSLHNRWRTQIKEAFKTGDLQVVVATIDSGGEIRFPNVCHIVQYDLPLNKMLFFQHCRMTEKATLFHIIFGENDMNLNNIILKGCLPDKEILRKFYSILKANEFAKDTAIGLTNGEFLKQGINKYQIVMKETGIDVCLKILEELALIRIDNNNKVRKIYFNPVPKEKLNIEDSPTYKKNMLILKELHHFFKLVFDINEENLLTLINKSI
ncbi:single-stranded-DNA-specific exonuclease RecJ [Anaerosinus massiliensis]|uniref:single-stranded-DNA-specific exonuclease RecJ n=1 Tax=Massilibacillus massiliensis TaxID=1806837 RepID=UPI000AA3BAEE|nr:single-stranded-DNA-specific exonuclease RecJ [Massilibacillus massiliensis]